MGFKSAPAASGKRKSSSTDKHSDSNRVKKAKTVTGPKHQKRNEDEGADSDGSGFSDSGDATDEVKNTKPARSFGGQNDKTAGKPTGS